MASTSSLTSRKGLMIGGGIAIAVVIGLLALFFLGDAPDAVSIDDAVGAADGSPAADSSEPAAEIDPEGTWTVDTEAQPYDFEASTGTFVGFRIDEELSTVGATTAVGRTPAVEGSLTLNDTTLTAATFSADITQLTTDQSRRDNKAREAMGADLNPTITFTLTEPVDLGAAPSVGDTITATATGNLTVNGVTNQVDVPLEAALSSSGVLVVTGSFDVVLADHDVTAPSASIVVRVADIATVEVQLYLTKGA